MSDLCRIIQGDCVEEMENMLADSIDLIVTSPTYDQLRTYGNKGGWNFENTAKEIYRLLIPGGVCCWNVGDATIDGCETLTSFRQAIYFKDVCGFRVETMIYEKSNGSKPQKKRYNQVFEYVFVLSKGDTKTVNLIRDKKNVTFGKSVFGKHTMREKDGSMTIRNNRLIAAEYGIRGNVWKGNTRGQEDICQALPHPAMMPKWLARDLILTWSNVGDTVLDPMAGGGTVPKMAISTGRKAIAIELNPDYCTVIKSETDVTPGLAI